MSDTDFIRALKLEIALRQKQTIKYALTRVRDKKRIEELETRIEELERLMDAARAVVQDLLLHAGIADAAPEDIDDVDRKRERRARAFLASAPAARPGERDIEERAKS